MEEDPKDLIVLGAIKGGAKKFDKISKITKIDPKELNELLERLEKRGLIRVEEKKGFFGPKVEIHVTDKGENEMEARVHELQQDWNQMVTLYKSGDKKKLEQYMDDKKGILPTMIFFGIIDMMMFSAMFSMMGLAMSNYVPTDQVPSDVNGVEGTEDTGGMDDGGFDIDIGF